MQEIHKQKMNVLWKPQPKQALALECPAKRLFYGGAAGGGKSDFLLMDFLNGARKYGKHYKGVIFRQTNSQLEELQNRAADLFTPLGAVFHGKTAGAYNTWIFTNGATLKMRYLDSVKDLRNYQGHEYTWVGFDELGNYPSPECFNFMFSRLRSPVGVPCVERGTGNPGGCGHGWIKQMFMDDHEPNKIFYQKVKTLDGTVRSTSMCFIPSRLEDNAVLMKNDPDYEIKLMSLPEHLARAMRMGDWSVFDGQVFDCFSVQKHVIKPFALNPGEWFKFAAMDWGFSKPFSIGWYAVNSWGRVIKYRELYGCKAGEHNVGLKMSAVDVAELAWEMGLSEGITDMVADPAIWAPNQISEGPSIAEVFEKQGFKMIKGNNDRKNGLVIMYQMLREKVDEQGTPMLTFFPCCKAFIRTVPMLTPNPNNMEDIDTDLEDHSYDETRYAIMSDFVKHPSNWLERQHGEWDFKSHANVDYDPFKTM